MGGRDGLTFIELVVVLLLIGLVTAIAMPNFVGMFRSTQTGSTARRLVGYMRYLQDKAVRENTEYYLVLDFGGPGPMKYWASNLEIPKEEMPIEFYYSPERERTKLRYPEYTDKFIFPVEMPVDVTIESLLNENDEDVKARREVSYAIAFHPDGTATKTTIYLRGPGDDIITIYIKPYTGEALLYEGREEIEPLPELSEEE